MKLPRRIICLGSMQIKLTKGPQGRASLAFFCMILFTDFTGTFKSSNRVGGKIPFRYFIQLIMFEMTRSEERL